MCLLDQINNTFLLRVCRLFYIHFDVHVHVLILFIAKYVIMIVISAARL